MVTFAKFVSVCSDTYLRGGHGIPAGAIRLSLPSNSHKRNKKTVEKTTIFFSSGRMAMRD